MTNMEKPVLPSKAEPLPTNPNHEQIFLFIGVMRMFKLHFFP